MKHNDIVDEVLFKLALLAFLLVWLLIESTK